MTNCKYITALINAHNHYRSSAHLPQLHYNWRLQKTAQSHANRMAQTQQMSHHENIPGRTTVDDRAHQAGYTYSFVGENIAAGQTTVAGVMTSWMNSTGHRHNILNGNYNNIGVAVAQGSNGVRYWCAVLGRKMGG
ncbi:unnamed protein product [Didymodactylos carnosus]|uniref:SCP domain-containing protein n=1 Tax=Didymodactylos carnosus TaxID=1234261 RepID=A0A814XX04_9BILA|nr:unnamed protein product [Didymodactylos carnosus]CAF1560979.1 unnamed protein product [Didymodactylos carnosus]CAF3984676.1 unnamed protein product [Didymodactylos carnosus]CAF4352751.1 unnamed protein product [Didymodactylos carnosus]